MAEGPETRLIKKMLTAAQKEYGASQVFFKHHGGPYARAGVSDLIGSTFGVFTAVEVKAPESYGGSVERALREGPTVKQREYVRKVLASGGAAGFAATIDQFKEILDCAERISVYGGMCHGHYTEL